MSSNLLFRTLPLIVYTFLQSKWFINKNTSYWFHNLTSLTYHTYMSPSSIHSILTWLFRMTLRDIIDRLQSEADMYSPMPSAFRTRRQRREDRRIERVLNFLIDILTILDTNTPSRTKSRRLWPESHSSEESPTHDIPHRIKSWSFSCKYP